MLKGFVCPDTHKDTPFDTCWKECRHRCMPLPVLLAVSKQMRESEDDVYHVTEILSPPQAVWLQRNKDYYVPPESLIDMNIGTSWHEKLEQTKQYVQELGLEDDYLIEKNFKEIFWWYKKQSRLLTADDVGKADDKIMELDSIILSGTPDLYVKSTNTLWDYKVTNYFYTAKYMLDNKWDDNSYMWQLNIYRRFNYRDARMKLFCYLKDWKRDFPKKYGVGKTAVVEVPKIPDRVVDNRVKQLLAEHVQNQRDSSKIRQCTKEEIWGGVRCESYCSVAGICPKRRKK